MQRRRPVLKIVSKEYLAHFHYRALPLVSKVVEGLPEIQTKHDGVCKGCAKVKYTKKTFPSSESKAKGILEIITLIYAV